jgi:hypothetical protein
MKQHFDYNMWDSELFELFNAKRATLQLYHGMHFLDESCFVLDK